MNRLQVKKQVISLLQKADLLQIRDELPSYPQSHLVNALFSCLCHPHEQVRWYTVSSFGFVVPAMAQDDMESARVVMRRFLWMLNDESGGIGWGVPEAMAEVIFNCRPLGNEYLHMLVSYTMDDGPELFQDGNFLELNLLQEGVLWGLCRVAPVYQNELYKLKLENNLEVYFHSRNSNVRGLVCRLTGALHLDKFRDLLLEAVVDQGAVRLYQKGRFDDQTVGRLAEAALQRI